MTSSTPPPRPVFGPEAMMRWRWIRIGNSLTPAGSCRCSLPAPSCRPPRCAQRFTCAGKMIRPAGLSEPRGRSGPDARGLLVIVISVVGSRCRNQNLLKIGNDSQRHPRPLGSRCAKVSMAEQKPATRRRKSLPVEGAFGGRLEWVSRLGSRASKVAGGCRGALVRKGQTWAGVQLIAASRRARLCPRR